MEDWAYDKIYIMNFINDAWPTCLTAIFIAADATAEMAAELADRC